MIILYYYPVQYANLDRSSQFLMYVHYYNNITVGIPIQHTDSLLLRRSVCSRGLRSSTTDGSCASQSEARRHVVNRDKTAKIMGEDGSYMDLKNIAGVKAKEATKENKRTQKLVTKILAEREADIEAENDVTIEL